MNIIVKTALTLTATIGLTTGLIAVKKHPGLIGLERISSSKSVNPIIIHRDGTVKFLGQIPPIEVATQIRMAVRNQNEEILNKKLIEHNFYVIPENTSVSQTR